MNNKQYVGLLVLIVLILGSAFYWYEYRPSQIKQRCSAEARFDQRAIDANSDIVRQIFIDRYYDDCLMRFGLR